MPRANRHFLPGQLWHIAQRCHRKAFLFKFARDRNRYLRWPFEARKRFGLRVLNYVVASNHVRLLGKDAGEHAVSGPQADHLLRFFCAREASSRASHGRISLNQRVPRLLKM